MQAEKDRLPPQTVPGEVALAVPDLQRSRQFYEQVIGLHILAQEDQRLSLGAAGGPPVVTLIEEPSATRPPRPSTGLYHLAILVPSRADLAHWLQHSASTRWPLQGAADHLVSEAIYLVDPDGNGIEIYRDRPRSEWPYRNGSLQMATDPLDVQGLLRESHAAPEKWNGMAPGTRLGHVHLRVADVASAQDFYTNRLGFDLVLRYGPSACFVSVGGYHHHIGFNSWESAGADPPPPGSAGLRYFSLCLPDEASLEHLTERLESAGMKPERTSLGFLVRDPSQNGILLTT
jgi:catechol 2,3-dioxygenase